MVESGYRAEHCAIPCATSPCLAAGHRERLVRVGVGDAELHHLDAHLCAEQAVAVFFQRQVVEDDVGQAAVSGGVGDAEGRLQAWVGVLGLAAGVDAEAGSGGVAGGDRRGVGRAGVVDEVGSDPDAQDAGDLAFAEADGESGVVGVGLGGGFRAALAAGFLLGADFLEAVVLDPEDVSGKDAGAVDAGDRGAVGAGLDAEVGEARAFDGRALGRVEIAAEGHADLGAHPDIAAGKEADDRAGDAADGLSETHGATTPRKR